MGSSDYFRPGRQKLLALALALRPSDRDYPSLLLLIYPPLISFPFNKCIGLGLTTRCLALALALALASRRSHLVFGLILKMACPCLGFEHAVLEPNPGTSGFMVAFRCHP